MTESEFKKLYEDYFRPLCLYALHYVSDASVAEDIVQDSFMMFWSKYSYSDNIHNGGSVKSVMYVIVKNRSIDWLRKTSSSRLQPEDTESLIADEDAQERSFDEAALWTTISKLPEKRRRILLMNKRDGMSYKAIAEELSVSVLTVRNHIALAMKELRKAKPVIQVIMTILMMLSPLMTYGQNYSMKSSMKSIEARYGYSFIYESSVKKVMTGVNRKIELDGKPLTNSLNELFGGLPVRWSINDKMHAIILNVDDEKPIVIESCTVSGYVTDSSTGETLIAAEVSAGERGSVTNNYGFYSLTLPKGVHTMTYSYIGCAPYTKSVLLDRDTTLNVALTQAMTLVSSVVSARKNAGFNSTYVGSVEVPDKLLHDAPALFGEPDVLKSLQMLPGIQRGTTFLSNMYVRGGNSDENLVLLDGIPVYNVSHLFGALSIFTPETIKKISVYKGSFPARYGGRASSIVDVRTNDGNSSRISGNVSVGLISDKLHLDGPVGKNDITYSISARGMHTLFVNPILKWVKTGGNYAFYDLNLKLSWKINDMNRLILNAYHGKDYMRTDYRETPASKNEEQIVTNYDYNTHWGNTIFSLGWNHIFNGRLFLDMRVFMNGYKVNTKSCVSEFPNENESAAMSGKTINFRNVSKINDIGISVDFDYTPSSSHLIKFGGLSVHHGYAPEDMCTVTNEIIYGNREERFAPHVGRKISGEEIAAYMEDDIAVKDWLHMIPGIRMSLFYVDGHTYAGLEPRFSVRADVGRGLAVKAAYSRMSQYIHQLVSGNLSLPTDLWVPVTGNIAPVKSDIYTAGVTYSGLKGCEFSAEVYWRKLYNVLEIKDGKLALSTSESWEENVAIGDGRAYGLELYLQKSLGKIRGICSYTLSKSERLFPDKAINNGKWYPFANDRRHNIEIALVWKFNEKIDASAAWAFMSGNYMTVPERETAYVGPDGKYTYGHYVSGRNNYKLPPTHHLDLSVNFTRKKKRGEQVWTIGVYNAYCALNPDWTYVKDRSFYSIGHIDFPACISQLSFLIVMPSFSYTYRF